jgi:single-strand DNA-binding protein
MHDPELVGTDGDIKICSFTLVIDDIHSKEDRADFVRVAVYGTKADVCKTYLRKGFLAGVTGRIKSDVYTDSEGVIRYPVRVIADNVQFLQWPGK